MTIHRPLDIRRLLDDAGIAYADGGGAWINMGCPRCGDEGRHLGYNLESGGFSCFRCGWMREAEAVSLLLGLEDPRAALAEYRAGVRGGEGVLAGPRGVLGPAKGVLEAPLPPGTGPLTRKAVNYLDDRGFSKGTAADWGAMATGPGGQYGLRLVLPVRVGGRRVNWQARDMTGRARERYLSCPNEKAPTPLKDCVYGVDRARAWGDGDTVLVVEGAFSVWCVGTPAVATFGAAVSDAQVNVLRTFKKRVILFDPDPAGREGAEKLAEKLKPFPGVTEIATTDDDMDFGELERDAVALLRKILL